MNSLFGLYIHFVPYMYIWNKVDRYSKAEKESKYIWKLKEPLVWTLYIHTASP